MRATFIAVRGATLVVLACLCGANETTLAAEPVPVEVSTLAALAVRPQRSAPATVISNAEIEISAELAARVVEFTPRVGEVLAAGAVLAQLDCRDYELDLRSAQANLAVLSARLELAERRLARARELAERNSLAEETLDERAAERNVLVAEINGARANIARDEVTVSRCVIRSPFRALVRERLAPAGDFVAIGDPIARVLDVEDLEVSAAVPEADIAAIKASAALEFALGEARYPLTLRTAVVAINSAARNQELRLVFSADKPLAGSAGQLQWSDPRPHVPGRVLVKREDAIGVFTIVDGIARFQELPQAQAGRASPVDLPAATVIVVEGHYGLRDGDSVEVIAAR